MLKNLKNKKIIISAGASGIGWTATKIFLSRGATVFLCDIDNKSLNKTKKHQCARLLTPLSSSFSYVSYDNFFSSFSILISFTNSSCPFSAAMVRAVLLPIITAFTSAPF